MTTSHIKARGKGLESGLKQVIELCRVGKKFPLAPTKPAGVNAGAPELWALKDISFKVCKGQIYGIIGRNGAGKTTLLNLLAATLSASEGEIDITGRVAGLLNLGAGFQDGLSGRENIFLNGTILGASRGELEERVNSIIEFSELGDFIHQPLGSYSQGMRLRLGFSIVVNLSFDILVIDEVLAVGDTLFQDKCFKRITEFRRAGKTLIITSQNMELIERLCDRVILLEHGRGLFEGAAIEGINRYRALLNTEKFYVGPDRGGNRLFEDTKKWADDISEWGKQFGTKEVVIEGVTFLDSFGFKCRQIQAGQTLRLRVQFSVKNKVKDVHFGVAIFRHDGVYCYGPNTDFDGYEIPELKPGKGWFELYYKNLLLAPGEYKISIAVWDKNEKLSFDYHNGCYLLTIKGRVQASEQGALLSMPFRKNSSQEGVISKDIYFTREPASFSFNFPRGLAKEKNQYAWAGIFRDDDIYCQGMVWDPAEYKAVNLFFPELNLLPGRYKVSMGVWDEAGKKFIVYPEAGRIFNMVFDKKDHGTVYLEHKWSGRFPV